MIGWRAEANIASLLPLPKPYPLQIPIEGAAEVRGPASAPVTIIEFTDFHCPYCRAAQSTLAEIDRRDGQHLRFVQHDLPIEQNPSKRQGHPRGGEMCGRARQVLGIS